MVAKLMQGFWAKTARIILRNRILILLLITAITVFLAMQWENMRFSNSEANILQLIKTSVLFVLTANNPLSKFSICNVLRFILKVNTLLTHFKITNDYKLSLTQ